MERAVAANSIDEMRRKEDEAGSAMRAEWDARYRFVNAGMTGEWRRSLPERAGEKILAAYGKTYQRFYRELG